MEKTRHLVSVIVPCYNEEKTIQLLLDSILKQDFPIQQMEVVIADAFSQDKTREKIAEFTRAHPELIVHVVDNPKCTIPAAVNAAARATDGEYLVRLDAHSMPYPNYISTCIRDLREEKGMNVGGVWEIHPGADTGMARAIAAAAANPLAVGDARYRFSNQEGEVDTVPFGSFRRDLFFDIGGFDESLLANEDYEFNVRIRNRGGKIWFDPHIRCVYFARKNLKELAKQYWRYGFWKFKMLKRYPSTLRWRQALPPVFVLANVLCLILFPFLNKIAILYLSAMVLYFSILLSTGIREALKKKEPAMMIYLPAAIMIMHFTWGTGFLISALTKK